MRVTYGSPAAAGSRKASQENLSVLRKMPGLEERSSLSLWPIAVIPAYFGSLRELEHSRPFSESGNLQASSVEGIWDGGLETC